MNSKDYKIWAMTKDRNGYGSLAERLSNEHGQLRLIHAILGIAGETGELTDVVKKHILYNKPLDVVNVKEECGDLLFGVNRPIPISNLKQIKKSAC